MGIASPTEFAAIGALGALLLVMAYGDFRWPVVIEAFKRTVLISAMAMAIILGGTVFTSIFMVNGGHTMIREAIQFLDLGVTGTIMAFLTIVFVLGFVLEWIRSSSSRSRSSMRWCRNWASIRCGSRFRADDPANVLSHAADGAIDLLSSIDRTEGDHVHGHVPRWIPFLAMILLTGLVVYLVPWTATWLPQILFRL